MEPRSKLACEFELRPLMTDFASGPFEREPPCLLAGLAGLGVDVATDASGVALASSTLARGAVVFEEGASAITDSVLLRSMLLLLLLPFPLLSPAKAIPAEEVMGADMDNADFLSDADASARAARVEPLRCAARPPKAMAADDFIPVDCDSTEAISFLGFGLTGVGAGEASRAATSPKAIAADDFMPGE
jgi:hypothetical protein